MTCQSIGTFLCMPSPGKSEDMGVGLPLPSFSLSFTTGPRADCEDVVQTICKESCLGGDTPSSEDDNDCALEDENGCDVVINSG